MIFFENLRRFKKKFKNKTNIKVSTNINFGCQSANYCFKNLLKKSNYYFEYGSGSSTLYANNKKKNYISIELDKLFYKKIKKITNNEKIKFVNVGIVGEYSYPLFIQKKKFLNYIKSIELYSRKKKFPDFILIDGRFRVACLLFIFSILKKKKIKTNILLDDYHNRPHYSVIKNFYKIKKIGRMAILKPKIKKLDKNLLNKYILDPR